MKMSFAIVIVFLWASVSGGQTVKPDFSYTLSKVSCDGMQHYVYDITRKMIPGQQAVLVITPNADEPWTALQFHRELLRAIDYLRLDHNIAVKFSPDAEVSMANLYLRTDAKTLITHAISEAPVLRLVKKPFFYSTDFSEGCTSIRVSELVQLLRSNPHLHVRILVNATSYARRAREIAKWRRLIVTNDGIANNRVRIVPKTVDPTDYRKSYSDFWIISGANSK